MNPSHQAGNITAVVVWGYPIISYWTAYQGLKQEVASTKHWLFQPRMAPTVHSSGTQ